MYIKNVLRLIVVLGTVSLLYSEESSKRIEVSVWQNPSANTFVLKFRDLDGSNRREVVKKHATVEMRDFLYWPALEEIRVKGPCKTVDFSEIDKLTGVRTLKLPPCEFKNPRGATSSSVEELCVIGFGKSAGAGCRLDLSVFPALKKIYLFAVSGLEMVGLDKTQVNTVHLKWVENIDLKMLRGTHVHEVIVEGSEVNAADLSGLPVEYLEVDRNSAVKNLGSIGQLKHLRHLSLPLRQNSDFDFESWKNLPVRCLTLTVLRGILSPAAAKNIASLPLDELSLYGVCFADPIPILQMPLYSLRIRQCLLPPNAISIMAKNKRLRRLSLAKPLDARGNPCGQIFEWNDLGKLRLVELDLSAEGDIREWHWLKDRCPEILILPQKISSLAPLRNLQFRKLIAPGMDRNDFQQQLFKYQIKITGHIF